MARKPLRSKGSKDTGGLGSRSRRERIVNTFKPYHPRSLAATATKEQKRMIREGRKEADQHVIRMNRWGFAGWTSGGQQSSRGTFTLEALVP